MTQRSSRCARLYRPGLDVGGRISSAKIDVSWERADGCERAPQSQQVVIISPVLNRQSPRGIKRASTDPLTLLVLSVLAGAFIAFGTSFATTVTAGSVAATMADGVRAFSAALPYGVVRLLADLVFSLLGLILVIVGGAELFTGNNLIVMAGRESPPLK